MNTISKLSVCAILAGGSSLMAQAPTVAQIQNNYSYVLPGLPNYGIAPGSLFIVTGANLNSQPLSALQSPVAPGIPTTLNGTSVSVTVAGTTVKPGLYYTSPGQLAAVLPSNTPVGTGTLTVTNNGVASTAAAIQVVQSALGMDTYYGSGEGLIVATDLTGKLISYGNSAAPGQTVTIWGSGVGADTSNDDRTYPANTNNLTSIPFQMYIGGVQANVVYRGRSQYPGVDQVNVQIPAAVGSGCYVAVAAVSGSVVSNSAVIPVHVGGGACLDTTLGVDGTTLQGIIPKDTFNFTIANLVQSTSTAGVQSTRSTIIFETYPPWASNNINGERTVSLGGCVVNPQFSTANPTITGLDPGTITLTGDIGSTPVPPVTGILGAFQTSVPNNFLPPSGGTYTFATGGSAAIEKISATLKMPAGFSWTNQGADATVARAQGLPVIWTGGGAGTYVNIQGGSTATINGSSVSVSFVCSAPAAAGQFTVPSYILQGLPAGSGTVTVAESTALLSITPRGLDMGVAYVSTGVAINAIYQ
jgi:uncharacterized protein (TIGR03437 family)